MGNNSVVIKIIVIISFEAKEPDTVDTTAVGCHN